MNATEPKPEKVGRKYKLTRFAMVSRKVGTTSWYGRSNYRTLEEAQVALIEASRSNRYQSVGGITVDFGPSDGERYERKIVKMEMDCEVVELIVTGE